MTLRIGILGAAKVAVYALIEPARERADIAVHAVAARDPARAAAYAKAHAIPEVCADYTALINCPDIEAVYVALPPNAHAKWSIAAAEAGKHVLCEKPFALSSDDVAAMNEAAKQTDKIIMEAQHTYYHPFYIRMREIIATGLLGEIKNAQAHFNIPLENTAGELRYLPDIGGGALWDLGIYPAHWLRHSLGREAKVTQAHQRFAESGADIETSASLDFDGAVVAELTCAMDKPLSVGITITGTQGKLEAGWRDKPLRLTIGGTTTEESFGPRPSYAYQLDAFMEAIATGTPPLTSGADSLATIQLLESIVATAKHATAKHRELTNER
jgi:predicted dehydrogenase